MPELPEVETIRRGVAKLLEGQVIQQVVVRETQLRWQVPEELSDILPQQTLYQVQRRGKYLLLQCSLGTVLIHLGMSGRLQVFSSPIPWQKHDHVEWLFGNHYRLRFHDPRRFGCVLWTGEPIERHPLLAHLGPEPLEEDFTGNYLYYLAQKRRVAIKSFIMDNQVVVGVGNIYANEALFSACIHPTRHAATLNLTDYQRLVAKIRAVLTIAIAQGGTTLHDFVDSTGQPGYFKQFLQVYGRAGLACVQCGNTIQQQKIGQRASYFCPVCQH